jgi:hypothetical protein
MFRKMIMKYAILTACSSRRAAAFLSTSTSVPSGTRRLYQSSSSMHGSIAEKVLDNPKWPSEWPYSETDFLRMDESDDAIFYEPPRLVFHIDDPAVSALTDYYAENLKEGEDVLDICSSWVSHYPKNWKGGKVVGLGMNEYELSQNKQLTSYVVKDLNKEPVLPFEDESFDKITCVVSVDYLNKPLEVFKEMGRVLRPGGEGILAMSKPMVSVFRSPCCDFSCCGQVVSLPFVFPPGNKTHFKSLKQFSNQSIPNLAAD